MKALLPVIAAGVTPFAVLTLIIMGTGLGLVVWQPPMAWMNTFGTPGVNAGNEVTALSASANELYAAGYVGYKNAGTTEPSPSNLFLNKYDLSGHQIWSRTFGNPNAPLFSSVEGMEAGADGVYIAASENSSVYIRKYDTDGNQLWINQFSNTSSYASIAAGNPGIYVSGFGRPYGNATLSGILSYYDSSGNVVWTVAPRNSTAHMYSDSTGLYATGYRYQAETGRGDTYASFSKYYLNGTFEFVRSFDNPPSFICDCEPLGISGDPTGIYISGNAYPPTAFPGQSSSGTIDTFLRKYDSTGKELWTIQLGALDQSANSSPISVSSSSVYLQLNGQSAFLMRYDSNGGNLWSFPMPQSFNGASRILATPNGVYVSGILRYSGGERALIAEFGLSSSLIFFGLNPPYSFLVVGALVSGVVLSVLWLRRRMTSRARSYTRTSRRSKSVPVDAVALN